MRRWLSTQGWRSTQLALRTPWVSDKRQGGQLGSGGNSQRAEWCLLSLRHPHVPPRGQEILINISGNMDSCLHDERNLKVEVRGERHLVLLWAPTTQQLGVLRHV